jgi:hypothetical protein
MSFMHQERSPSSTDLVHIGFYNRVMLAHTRMSNTILDDYMSDIEELYMIAFQDSMYPCVSLIERFIDKHRAYLLGAISQRMPWEE